MPRPNPLTPEILAAFLAALRGGALVVAAAARVGIAIPTLYRRRKRDPAFDRAWSEAAEASIRWRWDGRARRKVRPSGCKRRLRLAGARRAAFLTLLERSCNSAAAARAVGIDPTTICRNTRRDPDFASANTAALERGHVRLERRAAWAQERSAEAMKRIVEQTAARLNRRGRRADSERRWRKLGCVPERSAEHRDKRSGREPSLVEAIPALKRRIRKIVSDRGKRSRGRNPPAWAEGLPGGWPGRLPSS